MARPKKPKETVKEKTLGARFYGAEVEQVEKIASRSGMTVSDLFRSVLEKPQPRRARRRYPVKDAKELAQLLGAIGAVGNNVNQLARSANLGSWPETPLLEAAVDDIRWMRTTLMEALGVNETGGPRPRP